MRQASAAPSRKQGSPARTLGKRWLWPLLAALGVLGLALYLWPTNRGAPPAPVAQAPTVAPQPTTALALAPPRLAINNDDGVIHYSGVVHDDETRGTIVNALKAVFGPDLYDAAIGRAAALPAGEPADGIGAFAGPPFDPDDIEAHLSAWTIRRPPTG